MEDLVEAINIISVATCWKTDNECSTFLNEEREEVIELEQCGGVYKFVPHYLPFDPETLEVVLIKETEEDVERETILSEDIEYIPELGYVRIKLPECKCCNPCDKIETKKFLKVTYFAGYKTLPACLLPVMCNVLELIQDKRSCDCECDNCNNNTTTQPYETINYKQGDYITGYLEYKILAEKLGQSYYSLLAQISLCKEDKDMWCVVC